jgi:uncharacterized repeat protein (TIGR04138 family)
MSDDVPPFWIDVAASIGVPPDALGFTYDTFNYIRRQKFPNVSYIALAPQHVTAAEFSAAFVELAKQTIGDEYAAALDSWGVETSEKLGAVVFALVERNLIGKQDADQQSDFAGHFDFSGSAMNESTARVYLYRTKNWPTGPIKSVSARRYDAALVFGLVIAAVVVLVAADAIADFVKPVPVILIVYFFWIAIVIGRVWIQQPPRFSFRQMMIVVTVIALALGLFSWVVH